jgi:hypothetical protein
VGLRHAAAGRIQEPGNLHFTAKGSAVLAGRIAEAS